MREIARSVRDVLPATWRSTRIWRFIGACYGHCVNLPHHVRFHYTRIARLSRLLLLAAGLPLKRHFLVLRCKDGDDAVGLFSELIMVLGALEHYEKWQSCYAGLQVDFAAAGLYYEPASGKNWWQYYFEPVVLGSGYDAVRSVTSVTQHDLFEDGGIALSRQRGFELIDRYIRLQPQLRNKIDSYVHAHFQDACVVGVHYRGTDHFGSAPRVSYEQVQAAIAEAIERARPVRHKVFVATDEQAFLDYLLNLYPGEVLYREMFRSIDGRPIDVVNEDGNHKKGEDAVMDCLLLSRCNHLVRTASTLSECSTLFNPQLPQVQLNRLYD